MGSYFSTTRTEDNDVTTPQAANYSSYRSSWFTHPCTGDSWTAGFISPNNTTGRPRSNPYSSNYLDPGWVTPILLNPVLHADLYRVVSGFTPRVVYSISTEYHPLDGDLPIWGKHIGLWPLWRGGRDHSGYDNSSSTDEYPGQER